MFCPSLSRQVVPPIQILIVPAAVEYVWIHSHCRRCVACGKLHSKVFISMKCLNSSHFAGPEKGGYYHEMFLRGKQFLSWHICRFKLKGTGRRQPSSFKNFPDFSTLPAIPKEILSAIGNNSEIVCGKSGSSPCFPNVANMVLPLSGLNAQPVWSLVM